MENKEIKIYVTGCMAQIIFVVFIVCILRNLGWVMDYSTVPGNICVVLGGCSTALWGGMVTVKYRHCSIHKIIKDFFDVKKGCTFYPMIAFLLGIEFSPLLFGGHCVVSAWYIPIFLFLKAILFGGIEEIGWRYTLQPLLEKKIGFIRTTLLIFLLWGTWHYLYFIIDGTYRQLDFIGFYTGLLTNCFLLGIIYKKTNSLWLCVSTHALINTLSQTFAGGNDYIGYIAKACIILIVCYMVKCDKRSKSEKNK